MSDLGTKEQILKEIHYRRDKQWNIFSWASTIILGAIGGVVTISSSDYFRLEWIHGLALSLATICISIYSYKWITLNWEREVKATKIIKKMDNKSELVNLYNNPKSDWGYPQTIIGLEIIAVIFFIAAPSFLRSNTSIVYKEKSQKIIINTPNKTYELMHSELDSATNIFRNKVNELTP